MSRALLVLQSDDIRARAVSWITKAPAGTRVEFKAPRRTLDQNAFMWSMLSDIASALPWHGIKLTADDWKLVFLDALKRETRIVPNLDGNGFVNLGRSSSDLSVSEMADMITLIQAFGAKHNIKFIDQRGEPQSPSVTDTGHRGEERQAGPPSNPAQHGAPGLPGGKRVTERAA
jgi:hypothetical protein